MSPPIVGNPLTAIKGDGFYLPLLNTKLCHFLDVENFHCTSENPKDLNPTGVHLSLHSLRAAPINIARKASFLGHSTTSIQFCRTCLFTGQKVQTGNAFTYFLLVPDFSGYFEHMVTYLFSD